MTDLPPCKGYDSIMVIVDRFTKMAHYVPCNKSITAEETALLWVDRVYRHHGIPDHIISDRGTQFVSEFWDNFLRELGIEPRLSTSFHPETDGQTERINSILNQYLRIYCNFLQNNWVQLLPLAEFAYNNSIHSATGVSPFMANYGVNPRCQLSRATSLTDNPEELSERMKLMDEFLTNNLEKAREQMKRHADKYRSESVKYKPGDQVMLSLENISTRRPKVKWADKRAGPYTVIREAHPDSESYVLDLPKSWKIFPVFHTSLLTTYHPNKMANRDVQPPPPIIIDDMEEFEIESIIRSRRKEGRTQYLIKWLGYPLDEKRDWYHEDALVHAKDVLADFLASPNNRTHRKKRRRK
jgi:hypothetical protein